MTAQESESGHTLRQRAEEKLTPGVAAITKNLLSLDEANLLLHELQVHQIELEMQNEELRRSQAELGAERARYFDLYDLAPVGYCTISEKGLILEANLTIATALSVPRTMLIKQPISQFILKEDQSLYYQHRQQLLETGAPQACELRMVKTDGVIFWGQLALSTALDGEGTPVCRITLCDINELKKATEADAARERERERAAVKATMDGYLALFEQTGDGILILSGHGEIIKVNEAFAAMHGYSIKEMLSLGIEGMDVEGTGPVPDRIRRIMGGETLTFEVQHRHKDGHNFSLSVCANRVSWGGARRHRRHTS